MRPNKQTMVDPDRTYYAILDNRVQLNNITADGLDAAYTRAQTMCAALYPTAMVLFCGWHGEDDE